jgi:hypothetical protein
MKEEYNQLKKIYGTYAIAFIFSFDRFKEERKQSTLKEIVEEIDYLNNFF